MYWWYDSLNRKSKDTIGVSPTVIGSPILGTYRLTTLYRNIQRAKGPMIYSGFAGVGVALISLGVAYFREQTHKEELVQTTKDEVIEISRDFANKVHDKRSEIYDRINKK